MFDPEKHARWNGKLISELSLEEAREALGSALRQVRLLESLIPLPSEVVLRKMLEERTIKPAEQSQQ